MNPLLDGVEEVAQWIGKLSYWTTFHKLPSKVRKRREDNCCTLFPSNWKSEVKIFTRLGNLQLCRIFPCPPWTQISLFSHLVQNKCNRHTDGLMDKQPWTMFKYVWFFLKQFFPLSKSTFGILTRADASRVQHGKGGKGRFVSWSDLMRGCTLSRKR